MLRRPNATRRLVQAGRIEKTSLSRLHKEAKTASNCFQGKYFLLSNWIPRAASSPLIISARASTHSPSNWPLMSHGAIFTRGLFRTRFTFPETPMVYAYIVAPLESRLADGSGANHTGVFTPSPFFLNVSRFKYFCPANAAKLIASLLPTTQCTTVVRCVPFYMCYKHKRPFRPNRSTLCSGLLRFHLAFLSACITPNRFPAVSVR